MKQAKGSKTTPILRQYREAKGRHPGMALLARAGDFYQVFHEDAELAARVPGLTLSTRRDGGGAVPMTGFPHADLEKHLVKRLRGGHRVAVCDTIGGRHREQPDPAHPPPAPRRGLGRRGGRTLVARRQRPPRPVRLHRPGCRPARPGARHPVLRRRRRVEAPGEGAGLPAAAGLAGRRVRLSGLGMGEARTARQEEGLASAPGGVDHRRAGHPSCRKCGSGTRRGAVRQTATLRQGVSPVRGCLLSASAHALGSSEGVIWSA
jgi:hypothetical protein